MEEFKINSKIAYNVRTTDEKLEPERTHVLPNVQGMGTIGTEVNIYSISENRFGLPSILPSWRWYNNIRGKEEARLEERNLTM